MEAIDYCKELLTKYYVPEENENSEEDIDQLLEEPEELNFGVIIDNVYEKINELFDGPTNVHIRKPLYWECGELIGKSIVHEIKDLLKEGTYYVFAQEEIDEYNQMLNHLYKKYGINKVEMETYAKAKKENEKRQLDNLKNVVPIHWTYDQVI